MLRKELNRLSAFEVYAPEAYSNSASPPRQKLGDEFAFTVILLWHSKGCVLTTHLSTANGELRCKKYWRSYGETWVSAPYSYLDRFFDMRKTVD